jgi:hypothetical protein
MELAKHSPKISKFIILHDTVLFGETGQDGTMPGLLRAIEEVLSANPQWQIAEKHLNNNGLICLKRRDPRNSEAIQEQENEGEPLIPGPQ